LFGRFAENAATTFAHTSPLLGRLADRRSFVLMKQIEIRDALKTFDRPKNGGDVAG
jgi:hypothetical protein